MNTTRMWALVAVVGLGGALACAQDPYEEEQRERPRGRRDDRPPVLFLTPRIMHRVIDRISEGVAKHYEFDEDQLWNTRELWKERFPRFIMDNRDEIVVLINEYTAALLDEDPPLPEDVADWAQRAMPLIDGFTDLVEDTTEDMRTFMTEDQQVKLDGELAMFRVAVDHLNNRMTVWANGGYDWKSEWPKSEAFREKERERQEQLEREQRRAAAIERGEDPDAAEAKYQAGRAPKAATTQPEAPTAPKPKDDWTIYVEGFIKRYQLDEGQQNQARRILRSLQEQRHNYLTRKVDEINALERRLKAAETDEQREKVQAELKRLNEPLGRWFEQLKERLEPIPTRKQRAAAARIDMQTRAKTEGKPGSKDK